MLVLRVKVNEVVRIGDAMVVVDETSSGTARLVIDAPRSVPIGRMGTLTKQGIQLQPGEMAAPCETG